MSHVRSFAFLLTLFPILCCGQTKPPADFVRNNYTKKDVQIPMRDGARLYTTIYIPKEGGPYPILLQRTPYSCGPYGDTLYKNGLGPNPNLMMEKYIVVYQDVRGRYMSEGNFEEMTPHKDNKNSPRQTDESSDTWDTIDWLLRNITNNNGKVGLWGISYPGFYASACLADPHPAIKAVSPQAPVTDEFIGDDANHNGAFFLLDNFDFDNYFDKKRPEPAKDYGGNIFNVDIQDAYRFFLDMGPIKNSNLPQYFNNQGKIWNEYLGHATYDSYWKARNIRTHLKNVKPAVLVVGGFFDAEDMFGALRTYEAIEKQSPGNDNHIIMGPWTHGAWAGGSWTKFGILDFNQNVNEYYRDIETRFFNHYLKDKDTLTLPEATVFETGTNTWKKYATWPPVDAHPMKFYLKGGGRLSPEGKSAGGTDYDEYTSDPEHPVPYIEGVRGSRDNQYVVADQRFAAQRPDVLVYQTDPLPRDLAVTGRIKTDLFFSCSNEDADIVVKLIDVLPASEEGSDIRLPAGYQRLVRADVFRTKFRNSFETPEPLVPGRVTQLSFDLNEIAHTFKKGHRLMVQIQSSWFPLVDMNPQNFVNIPTAGKEAYQKARIRIYHENSHLSSITLPLIP